MKLKLGLLHPGLVVCRLL